MEFMKLFAVGVIYAVGLLMVLWALCGVAKIITEMYIDLWDRWVATHAVLNGLRRYMDNRDEIDRYLSEKHPEEN